jgi:hypothetical protein
MVSDTTMALVATNPIPWFSPWTTRHEARNFREEAGRDNGIVYVGVEANRTRQMYKATGAPTGEATSLGQLIDIYV